MSGVPAAVAAAAVVVELNARRSRTGSTAVAAAVSSGNSGITIAGVWGPDAPTPAINEIVRQRYLHAVRVKLTGSLTQ